MCDRPNTLGAVRKFGNQIPVIQNDQQMKYDREKKFIVVNIGRDIYPDLLLTKNFAETFWWCFLTSSILFTSSFIILSFCFSCSSNFLAFFSSLLQRERKLDTYTFHQVNISVHTRTWLYASFFLSLWKTLKLRCDEMNPSCNFPHEKRISVETTWKISVLFFLWFILKLLKPKL